MIESAACGIKLMIVDDDFTTRNGILRHMDWKVLGVEAVQMAEDAEKALLMCEAFVPDIVVSDIRMREMTGVELCRIIRDTYKDCQIIFISGYSDKEYLKAAIQLEAVDYVEKPVNPIELHATIKRAVERVKSIHKSTLMHQSYTKSRIYANHNLIIALLAGDIDSANEMQEMDELRDKGYSRWRICLITNRDRMLNIKGMIRDLKEIDGRQELLFNGAKLYFDFYDDKTLLVLLMGNKDGISDESDAVAWVKKAVRAKSDSGINMFLSVGQIVENVEEIYISFAGALKAGFDLFFAGWGSTSFFTLDEPKIKPSFDSKIPARLMKALLIGDEITTDELLDKLYSSFTVQKNIDVDFVKKIYTEIAYRIFTEEDRNSHTEAAGTSWNEIEKIAVLQELHAQVRHSADEFIAAVKKDQKNSFVAGEIEKIIDARYAESDLSVKMLADTVYLTPTYLSSLFKKKTGSTIGQFLTEFRIEKSKELLSDKSLKLYHVAKMVGYDDSNYFAKLFKKNVGITPSEYRETKLSEK